MATSITSKRSLKEHYLVCKDLMIKSGLDNDDLIVWGHELRIEDGGLDKALRRSSSTRRRVQRCLAEIEAGLTTQIDIAGVENDEKTIEEDIQDQDTRLEIKASVAETIQYLTRLSGMLAKPIPSDDLKHMTSASMAETFTQFDIKHVADKFPWASPSLQRRLGIMNRLRRWRIKDVQLLHREDMNEMARSRIFPPPVADGITENFEALSFNDESPSMPALSFGGERTATPIEFDGFSDDLENNFGRSNSISSASVAEGRFSRPASMSSVSVPEHKLFAPIAFRPYLYQKGARLFQERPVRRCPICFENIDLYLSEELWREHVLEDLEPYVCTVGSCDQSFYTFLSKGDWIDHELAEHHILESWHCRECVQEFESSNDFRTHIRNTHNGTFLEHQLDSIVAFSKTVNQRRDFGVQCPLCRAPLTGIIGGDAKHIATHLEDIALFVLQSLTDIFDADEGKEQGYTSPGQVQKDLNQGIGNLVIIFARCLEELRISFDLEELDDKIDIFATKLSFQRLRLALWGQAVGLVSGSPNHVDSYNTNIYRPDIRPKLEGVLTNLCSHLVMAGKSSTNVSPKNLTQPYGLKIFAEAYDRVYDMISKNVERFGSSIRVWSDKDANTLPQIVRFLSRSMDNLEAITDSFMSLEKLHNELRNEASAITDPSALVLIKDAAIELPAAGVGQTISDTASRCLDYVQSHGKPTLDLSFEDKNYGKSLLEIKDEEVSYREIEFAGFQKNSSGSATELPARRIFTELQNIWKGNIPFISVQLVDTNIDKLLASIEGPPDTPYSGGVFWITVKMPTEDPFGIPRLKFHTKIYHPNIDVRGNICTDSPVLWNSVFSAGYVKKPSTPGNTQSKLIWDAEPESAAIISKDSKGSFQTWTLSGLLIAICGLLASPNIHDPLVPEIARQYLDHYDWFCDTARSVTLRYATAERPQLDTLVFPKSIANAHSKGS